MSIGLRLSVCCCLWNLRALRPYHCAVAPQALSCTPSTLGRGTAHGYGSHAITTPCPKVRARTVCFSLGGLPVLCELDLDTPRRGDQPVCLVVCLFCVFSFFCVVFVCGGFF